MSPTMLLTWIIGVVAAIPTYIILSLLQVDRPFTWTVLGASALMLVLYPILRLSVYRTDKRYAAFEAGFQSPFFHRMNANIKMGKSVRNGNLYFCEQGIILASLDEKPVLVEELPRDSIQRFTFDEIHMEIYVNDGRVFRLTSPEIQETYNALQSKNWII